MILSGVIFLMIGFVAAICFIWRRESDKFHRRYCELLDWEGKVILPKPDLYWKLVFEDAERKVDVWC